MIKTLQILLCYTIAFLSTHTTHAQLGLFEVCGDFEVLSTSTFDAELAASTDQTVASWQLIFDAIDYVLTAFDIEFA
mgnify:CR=1 FL=1